MAAPSSLSVLRVAVTDRISLLGSDPAITPTKITAALNSALRQVTLDHDWPWLQQTVQLSVVGGLATYPAPADWLRTVHLIDSVTGIKIVRASLEAVDSFGSRTGTPALFAAFGGSILLAPVPQAGQTLIHRYIRSENILSSDGNAPLIPSEYEEGVIEYAAYLCLRQLKEAARAQEALLAYREWKKRAEDNIQQGREPIRVTHRPGGWPV